MIYGCFAMIHNANLTIISLTFTRGPFALVGKQRIAGFAPQATHL